METACEELSNYLKKQPSGKDIEAKSVNEIESTPLVVNVISDLIKF